MWFEGSRTFNILKFRVFWDVAPFSHVTTRRYISEDSKIHTGRRENLKFHV
jgi:hypothetical protein